MNKNKKLALCSLFLAAASIIGFLESLVPIPFLTALPGVRLGFANIAVVACYKILGKKYAFSVALFKPFVVFLFSGNALSLALSLCGGLFAYLGILLLYPLCGKVYSFIALSATNALLHILGQLLCASLLLKTSGFIYLLPYLCIFSCICGVVTGIIMNLTLPHLCKKIEEYQ